jgi:hypothetical protein
MRKIIVGDYVHLHFKKPRTNNELQDEIFIASGVASNYIMFITLQGDYRIGRGNETTNSDIISVHSKEEMIQLYPELMI